MKKMTWRLAFALCLCVMMSQMAYADVYWETVTETKGMPQGMPPNMPKEMMKQFNKTETVKNYMSEKAFRSESGDTVTIMDFDAMMVYHLNPKDKTCTKMDLKAVANNEKMAGMVKEMQDSMKITPANESKKIAGYDCKKYQMSGMMGEGEYWVSKDVKGYEQYKTLSMKMQTVMGKTPMFTNMMGAVGKMDGFPVQTTMKVMGMTTISTLKQIEEKTADKNLFKVPEGYKISDMPMMDEAHQPPKMPMKKPKAN